MEQAVKVRYVCYVCYDKDPAEREFCITAARNDDKYKDIVLLNGSGNGSGNVSGKDLL